MANKEKVKKSVAQQIREWVVTFVVALAVVLAIRECLCFMIRVDGSSMSPTLKSNEMLFYTSFDGRFGAVQRGEVVICHYPNRGLTHFVKRVVAVPGDTVYRENGVTHVVYTKDGEQVDIALDAGTRYALAQLGNDYAPYVLGEKEYFVVGDNRGDSHDSRDWNDDDDSKDVGPLKRSLIVGHVRSVVWPLDGIRAVEAEF